MRQMEIQNLDGLAQEAVRLVGSLAPHTGGATLVTLSGDLGAGKTAFTKVVATALGVTETVTSPTFVLEKIYALPESAPFKRLIHIDAYRLEGGAELAPLGFDEVMKDSSNLILLEWPEKVRDGLPEPTVALTLTVTSDTSRTLTYG